MKKVLHRSFKPAKCKTALQMAASRLKILKNKKDTQIKQLRRELAQLLESGQTQTAKIRVEHVVREEKTVAAYELVSIYCELLVVRLGVIDSQKTCPNDLKEAVTSVLYASQRLSDVTELSDIVKHFSAKYGKDFVSAAIGLQPDSGVSRLLVDKLSVKAPDGATKIKILTEIATQHNVTWEAESLVESDPKETVSLSGASSSQSTIGINSDSSRITNNQPPVFQAPATVNVSQSSYASDRRSSSRTHGTISSDFNIGKTADHYHQDPRPSGDTTDGREHRHPHPGHGDSSPWETEFVDATSAARAAAESAERASFAARAAAELSSKERMMAMQNSTESRNSSSYDNLGNNPPQRHSSCSNVQSGGFAEEDKLRSSNRQEDQSTTRAESSNKTVDEQSENASWRSGHSRENSSEMRPNNSFDQIGREKKQPSMDDINLSSSEDVLLKKQSSKFSDDNDVTTLDHIDSPSILEENRFQSTVSHEDGPDVVAPDFDDYSSFFDKPQFDTEDAYHDEPEEGLGFSLLGSSSKTPDHMPTETNSWSVEEHKSLGQPSSTSQVLENEKPSSPIFDDGPTSSPIFDDGPTSPPASLHEVEPSAMFDDYDRDSESEEDKRNKGKISGHVEEKLELKSHKSPISEVPDDLGRYFFPSDTEDQGDDSKIQEESDTETPSGLGSGPLAGGLKNETTLPSYGMSPPREKIWSNSVKEHVPTEVDPPSSSSLQTVSFSSIRKELYTQKASNTDKRPSSIPPNSSSSDDESEMKPRERISVRYQDKRTESRTRPINLHSRVSHEDSEENIPTRASTRSQESRRTHKTTPASSSYFHSISSDDEDEKEVQRDAARTQTKPSISISRRTKGRERRSSMVTAKTDKVSYDQESPPKSSPEAKPLTKQQVSASSSSSLPKTDKASHDQESLPKLCPETKLTKQQGSAYSLSILPKTNKASDDQKSPPKLVPKTKPVAKQQGSATSSSSLPKTEKVSYYREPLPEPTPEAKSLAKQQGSATSSSSLPKTEKVSHYREPTPEAKSLAKQEGSASSSSSLPKTVTSLDPVTPEKEKASHVHPKLPDYDDIFAKLGALRR